MVASALPPLRAGSGNAGFGSRLAQVPLWMCIGWLPAGCPVTLTVTLVLPPPASLSVAVPDCPELFWGSSFTVTSAAPATPGTSASTVRARTASRTAFDMGPPWLMSCAQPARLDHGPGATPGHLGERLLVSAYATTPDRTTRVDAPAQRSPRP